MLAGVSICIAVVNLTSCSNTKEKTQPAVKAKPVKHHVKTDAKQKQEYAKLLEIWDKQALEKSKIAKKIQLAKNKSNTSYAATAAKKLSNEKVVYEKRRPPSQKQIVRKRAAKKQIASSYRTPSHRAPNKNIQYASLSGDYVSNQQTRRFIDKMVSKHGFDRGYLNYLFTNTESTPFLKRMAASDARGPIKSNKKSRSGRWNRYRGNFLTEKTISKGVQFWRENRVALQQAEQKYGVPQEYILGIIGVETRYGGNVGQNRAIDALSAMGFNNARRGKYFQSELESYLLMTRKEGLDPLKPMASYAGALGLCQFMPSNIKRYAVDHDRNGHINLWTPKDAIGSVANYFKKHGWKTGGTVAVRASSKNSSYKSLRTGFKSSHSLNSLKSRGVSADYLGDISGKASLIKLNTYSGDELWLGGHNFYVITRYNHSSHYAMAVHQLAEAIDARIGGKSVIRQASIDSDLDAYKALLD
ncbi:hypothetical protein GCM10009133_27760 [Cocleimonas flava]